MVKSIPIFACPLTVALDVTAGILGIKAEAAQNQEKHFRLRIFECIKPSHNAFVLGVASATLLCIAHVFTNLIGRCNICTREGLSGKQLSKVRLSMACLAFTWIILAVGLGMLVIGIISNSKSRAACDFTHHNFLSDGGILCFVHALFSVAYYAISNAIQAN